MSRCIGKQGGKTFNKLYFLRMNDDLWDRVRTERNIQDRVNMENKEDLQPDDDGTYLGIERC